MKTIFKQLYSTFSIIFLSLMSRKQKCIDFNLIASLSSIQLDQTASIICNQLELDLSCALTKDDWL